MTDRELFAGCAHCGQLIGWQKRTADDNSCAQGYWYSRSTGSACPKSEYGHERVQLGTKVILLDHTDPGDVGSQYGVVFAAGEAPQSAEQMWNSWPHDRTLKVGTLEWADSMDRDVANFARAYAARIHSAHPGKVQVMLSHDAEEFYALPECEACGGSGKQLTKGKQ